MARRRSSVPMAPICVSPPTILGDPYPGALLTCVAGRWVADPSPNLFFEWKKDGVAIPGATEATYTPDDDDVGGDLSCVVTGKNVAGSSEATTKPFPIIAAPVAPNVLANPAITGGTRVGEVVSCSLGTWSGTEPIVYSRQWTRNTLDIPEQTGASYTMTESDVGNLVGCRVTALNAGGSVAVDATPVLGLPFEVFPPTNIVPPVISGLVVEGQTISLSDGEWTGSPTITFAYRWEVDEVVKVDEVNATLTLVNADVGKDVVGFVIATNPAGTVEAASEPVTVEGLPVAPANTVAPAISGTPQEGVTLSCSNGTWTGTAPITYARQWKVAGIVVSTASTYVPTAADVGKTLLVTITASGPGGEASANSNSVTITAAPTLPVNVTLPEIQGSAILGATVTAWPGEWSGTTPFTYAFQWKRDGVSISGATGSTRVIDSNDVDNELTVTVTATGPAGAGAPATSLPVVPTADDFAMAATRSFSIDPIRMTTQTIRGNLPHIKTPRTLGSCAATGHVEGIVYSLSTSRAAKGFAVDPATGDLIFKFDFLVLDQCLGGTRTFNVLATKAGVTKSTLVTVVLDISDAAHYQHPIPGISYPVGSDEPETLISLAALWNNGVSPTPPAGWSFDVRASSHGFRMIVPNSNGVTLDGYDCRGFRYYNRDHRTGVTVRNCYFDWSAFPNNPTSIGAIIIASNLAETHLERVTVDCGGREHPWRLNATAGRITTDLCRFIAAPNDVFNSVGCYLKRTYGSTSNTNNREAGTDGINAPIIPVPPGTQEGYVWGHSDGFQGFGISDRCYIEECYIDVRWPFDDPIYGYRVTSVTSAVFFQGTLPSKPYTNQNGDMILWNSIVRGASYMWRSDNTVNVQPGTIALNSASKIVTASGGATFAPMGIGYVMSGGVPTSVPQAEKQPIRLPGHPGVELIVKIVNSATELELEDFPPVTDAAAAWVRGPFRLGEVVYRDTLVSDYLLGYIPGTLSRQTRAWGIRDLYTGAAQPDINPPIVAVPAVTVVEAAETYVRLAFATQPNTKYKMRRRVQGSGSGGWGSFFEIDLASRVIGEGGAGGTLAGDTDFDGEIYGFNDYCYSDDFSTFLVADGPVTSFTFSTTPAVSYETETTAAVAAMTTAPDTLHKNALNAFIKGLKDAGLWTKCTAAVLPAAQHRDNARVNLRDPSRFQPQEGATVQWTAKKGYWNSTPSGGDATGFVALNGCRPSMTGEQWTLAAHSVVLYITEAPTSTTSAEFGSFQHVYGVRQFGVGLAVPRAMSGSPSYVSPATGVEHPPIGMHATVKSGGSLTFYRRRIGQAVDTLGAVSSPTGAIGRDTEFLIGGRNVGAAPNGRSLDPFSQSSKRVGATLLFAALTPAELETVGGLLDAYMLTIGAVATPPALPTNQSLPVISGTPQVGVALSATAGGWLGTTPITHAYQWRAAGVDIAGATGATFTPTLAEVGATITVRVTATNSVGSASATSAGVGPVAAPPTLDGRTFASRTFASRTFNALNFG